MRIRSIRPEFWRSDDIDRLDWHTRLVFIGLWSYVDDNGVGRDRVSDIAADLFSNDLSRDPRETLARVAAGLRALRDGGQISRYNVAGKAYLHVTAWSRHQRVDNASKVQRYPLPTDESAVTSGDVLASREPQESLATPSREARETRGDSPLGEGEKGRRGEGFKNTFDDADAPTNRSRTRATDSPAFDAFWAAYPRRAAKADALKAWKQMKCERIATEVIAGAERYRDDPNRLDSYTKLPAGWLRDGRWSDDPLPGRPSDSRASAEQQHYDDLFSRAAERAAIADAQALDAINGYEHSEIGAVW